MPSPAEELAAKKPWRREPRNVDYKRKKTWKKCQLRKLRESLRLSLSDVAQAVGYGVTTIHQLEHGTDPMLTTAKKLATFFGVSVDAIWGDE